MDLLISGALSAFWLGILTSISPCPLATNIAAISFIGKQVKNARSVLISGIMYTIGRMTAYVLIAFIVVFGLLSTPKLSHILQEYMNMILGPALIVTGMFLLNLITLSFRFTKTNQKAQDIAQKSGIWSSGVIGLLFALSFCPVTAALFFGSLIPLSLKYESSLLLPALFGIGTGIPVFLFALAISFGAQSVNLIYKKVSSLEIWFRRITGILFLGIGIYLSLKHIFELF
ncbi:aromatic aminobenezylarsenical efflux permease ArsG family transporter [candidate division KSB1 bacterium]